MRDGAGVIRLMKPLQWAMPRLVPVTAKIIVHSKDVVERQWPDGVKYLDSKRKTVMRPMRVFWCLAFGSDASERARGQYSGASFATVKDGICDVLSKSVRVPDIEDDAVAEIQITVEKLK